MKDVPKSGASFLFVSVLNCRRMGWREMKTVEAEKRGATHFDKHLERKNFKSELIEGACLVGKYGFPKLKKTTAIPRNVIPFNLAKTETETTDKWIHFFIDDYQFERIWNFPARYISMLRRFEGVISTDYSMFLNMPLAQRIWNCYRNRAMDYWMQNLGINVVPVVEWADYRELEWCLDGIPKNSTVAIGLYGCSKNSRSRYNALKGIEKVCVELDPYSLICYGKEIRSINSFCKRVIFLENYCKTIKKRV